MQEVRQPHFETHISITRILQTQMVNSLIGVALHLSYKFPMKIINLITRRGEFEGMH